MFRDYVLGLLGVAIGVNATLDVLQAHVVSHWPAVGITAVLTSVFIIARRTLSHPAR